MKKLLLVFLILVLLTVLTAVIFLITFDADRYRPALVKRIEQATGKKVTLDHLALVWQNGIALQVRGLTLYADTAEGQKPAAKLQEAACVVRLLPLFKKEIQISSIVLKSPALHIMRAKDGSVAVAGVKIAPTAAAQPAKKNSSSSNILFSVDSIKIRDAEIGYHDSSVPTPLNIKISDLDTDIHNVSATRPMTFDLRAAVFSPAQNIAAKGKVTLAQGAKPGTIEDFSFSMNLASLDIGEVLQSFPQLQSSGIKEPLAGDLEVAVSRAKLGPDMLDTAAASARLQDGKISLKELRTPIDRLNADLLIQGSNLTIRDLSGNVAEGSFKITGTVKQFTSQALSDFKATFQDLSLGLLMPAAAQNAPRLGGRVSLGLDGQARGLAWSQISQTLSGKGRLTLKDGVLLNYNVLRTVIEKISSIPSIGEQVQSNLPGLYKAKLGEPSTLLAPVDLFFTIERGQMNFEQLSLSTDVLSIVGRGRVGLDRTVNADAWLSMSPPLSSALMNAAPQTQLLLGNQGQLQVPIRIQGQLPRLLVLPDTDYLFQKIAVAKAPEIINSLMNKTGDNKSPLSQLLGTSTTNAQSTTPAANSQPTQSSPESQLANLLGQALKKNE